MRPLHVFLLFILLSPFSASAENAAYPRELTHRSVHVDGKEFYMTESLNQIGVYEVRVFLKETQFFVFQTLRLLLIGRAVDVPQELIDPANKADVVNPHRVTTWYMAHTLQVLEPLEYIQTTEDPWPTAYSVIKYRMNSDARWFTWAFLEDVAPQLSLAFSYKKDFLDQIREEQINLYELDIRLDHLQINEPQNPQIPLLRQVVARGWKSIADRIQNDYVKNIWLNAAGDGAIVAVAGAVGKGFAVGGEMISKTAVGKVVTEAYANFTRGINQRVAEAFAKAGVQAPRLATQALAFAKLGVKQQVIKSVSYLHTRSMVGRIAINSVSEVMKTGALGLKQIKYVGMASGLQVAAETLARPEDLFDPNPIVMLQKMSGDAAFLQNVAYMSNETFWMSGVSARFTSSLKKRMVICGAIALFSSVTMSLLVRQKMDPTRIGTDTSWEMVVGNVQTQADMAALKYFEGLATKSGDGKLKLIGYAVAFVDQGAGYFGYAKMTHFFESLGAPPIPTPPPVLQAPKLELIPIMGPA